MTCEIEANCSQFQSLNVLPFYIRLERLKLTGYSLISVFSRYFFTTGKLCFLFESSHVSAALQFDSNSVGILFLKDSKATSP